MTNRETISGPPPGEGDVGEPLDPDDAASTAQAPTAATHAPPPRSVGGPVASATLFGGASELQISHRGAIYRLKQTALGKLILTK